jgi:hypothetical protein
MYQALCWPLNHCTVISEFLELQNCSCQTYQFYVSIETTEITLSLCKYPRLSWQMVMWGFLFVLCYPKYKSTVAVVNFFLVLFINILLVSHILIHPLCLLSLCSFLSPSTPNLYTHCHRQSPARRVLGRVLLFCFREVQRALGLQLNKFLFKEAVLFSHDCYIRVTLNSFKTPDQCSFILR